MSRRAATLEFLDAFCSADLERLGTLLVDDLRFEGPLLSCTSREAYLERLREDPPEPGEHRVRRLVEEGDQVAVLWDYRTSRGSLAIAQWNRFRDGRIAEIVLLFDVGRLGGELR